ncbi:MAG: RimK family protein, partial [Planctomycetes bacterium]|nr:RimK family protein [Planctomycetota bacterium]
MRTIVVVAKPSDWPVQIAGVDIVPARDYLTNTTWTKERHLRVVNLCRSYRYQENGYYVSLLATARRHKPFPDLRTVLDMKSRHVVRTTDDEFDALIQKSLSDIHSDRFELSIYFGRNLAQRHERLAWRLFTEFQSPLLRASFHVQKNGKKSRWHMTSIAPIGFRDVPESHRQFVAEAAATYLGRKDSRTRPKKSAGYSLAVLFDPEEELAPSDPRALKSFRKAANAEGIDVDVIDKGDYARLGEYDALFLRETTLVDHHTFRFAQRAESDGLVVIDDPTSILRCTNKVFQAEAFESRGIATPKTWITDCMKESDVDHVVATIGLPCVLKHPDSSFSQGVIKCADREELATEAARILEETDLLVVQEFMPTDFDWRIGLFGGEPLWSCRYEMAKGHWQIVKKTGTGKFRYGNVVPVKLEETPTKVIKLAKAAAAVIGDGLYGVDLKISGKRLVVTEVNDNPNINAGLEDADLGEELYRRLARGFLARIERKKKGPRG